MTTTARISINIDADVKKEAQRVLSEIGMDLTTAIDTFLRTVIREERIPLDLQTVEAYKKAAHTEYIKAELAKAKSEAADTGTQWISQEDMIARIAKRREVRNSAQS